MATPSTILLGPWCPPLPLTMSSAPSLYSDESAGAVRLTGGTTGNPFLSHLTIPSLIFEEIRLLLKHRLSFPPILKNARLWMKEELKGRTPRKLLSPKSKYFSFFISDRNAGTEPLNRLELRSRWTSSVICARVSGIAPDKELPAKEAFFRETKLTIASGRTPDSELELKSKNSSDESCPIEPWTGPLRLFPERSTRVMLRECQWCGKNPARLVLEIFTFLRFNIWDKIMESPLAVIEELVTASSVRLTMRLSQTPVRRLKHEEQVKERRV